MPRRLGAVFAVVALGLVAQTGRATAHPVERFTACAAVSATDPNCPRLGTVIAAGQTVFLRGRVSPAHPGFAEVWRRAPYSSTFVKVGGIGISETGRIRWTWQTEADDATPRSSYAFQFRIPRHGRSWVTRVQVRAAA